jgi:hypothetical protein
MTLFNSKIAQAIGERLAPLVVAIGAALMAAPAGAQLNQALDAQQQVDRESQQAQQQINEIRERTQDAASRYAQALNDADSLERYNAQLSEQVASQETEIASIEQQLLDIETTTREVQPLMQQMVDTLDRFVALDVPFLLDERTNRVANLKNMMSRADITISEKYRLILEAYQIELDYGQTLEAYEGRLESGGETRTVEFVKLGRVSLMYTTLDATETGYWDHQQKTWVVDDSYAEAVQTALRVAKRAGSPDLLTVPVPAPQGV